MSLENVCVCVSVCSCVCVCFCVCVCVCVSVCTHEVARVVASMPMLMYLVRFVSVSTLPLPPPALKHFVTCGLHCHTADRLALPPTPSSVPVHASTSPPHVYYVYACSCVCFVCVRWHRCHSIWTIVARHTCSWCAISSPSLPPLLTIISSSSFGCVYPTPSPPFGCAGSHLFFVPAF